MYESNKVQRFPVVGKQIRRFDELVGSVGLPAAMRNIVERTKSRLAVSGLSEELTALLRNEPCLVIGNHERDTEPIPILAALPDRKDVFIVGTSDFSAIGPNFAKQLLPVYIRSEVRDRSGKLSARMGKYLQFGERPSDEESHRLNMEMIGNAVGKIKDGGLVVIFPEGPSGGMEWFNGVGFLVSDLMKSKVRFSLVFAHAAGVSGWDVLRPVLGSLMPVLRVSLSDKTALTRILKQKEPRSITKVLHDQYERWREGIPFICTQGSSVVLTGR